MKGFSRLFLIVMTATALLVSACGASASPSETSSGSSKPLASLIPISGYIEAIDGNQWTIGGKLVTVDPSMLEDDDNLDNYQVGDYVEIKVEVLANGSLIARSFEDDNNENDGNANDNANDNSNGNGNDNANANDNSNSNGNNNDDDSNGNDNSNSNGNNNDDDSNNNDDDDSNDNDDDSNGNDNDD